MGDLGGKCADVIKWSLPDDETEDEEEKEAWRAQRRAQRQESIERLHMKEIDRKKEEDRVALEKFKKDNPEEYKKMMEQQEEEKRQKAEIKRRERMRAAALERQRLEKQETDAATERLTETKQVPTKKKSSMLYWITSISIVFMILGLVYVTAVGGGGGAKPTTSKSTSKKKSGKKAK